MTRKTSIAVLISGGGSNLQALMDTTQSQDFPGQINLVIANRPNAYGLIRAKQAGIPALCIDHTAYPDRATFEDALHAALRAAQIELICLAGFMRVLTADFVNKWKGRILNIHPSLLPHYRGIHAQQQALNDGAEMSGCTVHIVTPHLDDGPILGQRQVPILPDDDVDSLSARILQEEHRLYPEALRLFLEQKDAQTRK